MKWKLYLNKGVIIKTKQQKKVYKISHSNKAKV